MTPLQTAELRAGALRKNLAELGAMPELDAEQRASLDKYTEEYAALDSQIMALKLADDTPAPVETRNDTQGREMRRMLTGGNVGDMLTAILGRRGAYEGVNEELRQHYGLAPNQIPLAMLTRMTEKEWEERAVTPGPANAGENVNSVVPWVFPDSVASFLGIDMPSVPAGESVYPILTKELDVRTPAENTAAAETTGTFSSDVLAPSRIQASFFYSREDSARWGELDSALRENISAGLSDGLDQQIMEGTNGLLTGTVLANHNQTTATSFDNYISQFAYGRVDGRYASMTGDLRIVMGASTYAHAGNTYRNTSVDRTALDRLMDLSGGVRVSAHVPAAASNKQNNVIRLGMRRDMVAPTWTGITIIPDEITKADEGQIKVTGVMLFAVKLLRADGFFKQQVQVA